MLMVHGRRQAKIKRYRNSQEFCSNCKSFDLDIFVYRDYYHLFFIPFFPIGEKLVTIFCYKCGHFIRNEPIEKKYGQSTKTPFYLYAGLMLVCALVLFIIAANLSTQKEKQRFVENPKAGDVYTIRNEENNTTTYYFLRVKQITGDTVWAYHSNLEYGGFTYKLAAEDFFVETGLLTFLKTELKDMLERGEINSVDRNYGDEEGFNRIR